jgi:hypothetical protein
MARYVVTMKENINMHHVFVNNSLFVFTTNIIESIPRVCKFFYNTIKIAYFIGTF